MNQELINRLVEEAKIPWTDEGGIPCVIFSKDKFAELIIKECVKQMWTEIKNTSLLMSNPPQSSAIWDARNKISIHFGIKL